MILYNGKVQLQPYKVTYTRTYKKTIKEGYIDEETQKPVKPVIEEESREFNCSFDNQADAIAYAEATNGTVTDSNLDPEIVEQLETMTFSNLEEARAFIEDGIAPTPKLTIEGIAKVVDEIVSKNI